MEEESISCHICKHFKYDSEYGQHELGMCQNEKVLEKLIISQNVTKRPELGKAA